MTNDIIKFLEDYKRVCIKHKKQIVGFDDGACVVNLEEDEYKLEALIFEEYTFDDGSVKHSNLHFASLDELGNSITGVRVYVQSSIGVKEE